MKTTNLLKSLAAAFTGIAMFGCTPADNGDGSGDSDKELNENLVFTLEVVDTDEDSATIRVSHNGDKTDTWYGFETTEADIDKAIEDKIDEITQEDGSIKGLKSVTEIPISLRNLEHDTQYTYVAFGLSKNGTVYGEIESVEFTTGAAAITSLTQTNDWTIEYVGRSDEGQEVFTVDCADNSLYLFDLIDEYYITDEDGNSYLNEYMLMMVQNFEYYFEKGITVEQLLQAGYLQQGPGQLATDRMPSGNYHAFAIGFNEDGTPIGTYSSKAFQIQPETASDAYLQWIGTYTVQSADGTYFDIQLEEYDPNYMYAVIGWETGDYFNRDEDNDGEPDGVDFNQVFEGGFTPIFPAYFNNGDIEFYESTITQLEMQDGSIADFGLYGWGTYMGERQLLYTGGALLGTGSTTDNGATGTITGSSVKSNDGTEVNIEWISYAAMSESYYWWFNQPLQFPITMTKKADEPVQQQNMMLTKDFNRKKFNADKKAALKAPKTAFKATRR